MTPKLHLTQPWGTPPQSALDVNMTLCLSTSTIPAWSGDFCHPHVCNNSSKIWPFWVQNRHKMPLNTSSFNLTHECSSLWTVVSQHIWWNEKWSLINERPWVNTDYFNRAQLDSFNSWTCTKRPHNFTMLFPTKDYCIMPNKWSLCIDRHRSKFRGPEGHYTPYSLRDTRMHS